MDMLTATVSPWAERSKRARQLLETRPYAAELLRLYAALTKPWAEAWEAATTDHPELAGLPAYAARKVLPGVLEATLEAGPARLRAGLVEGFHAADFEQLADRWLRGEPVSEFERYLARAALAPLLEALPEVACELGGGREPDSCRCPACGGLPQLAYFGVSGDALVTAPRYLLCSRCSLSWAFPRMVCAACGSAKTSSLPIFADEELLVGLRIDACESCRRYLVTVELPKDPAAVPVVDELTALPLDLYAQERGFNKVTANLMGI